MKKLLSLGLALLLLAGCAAPAPKASQALAVTVSAFPEYDFVRAVAGDLADITLLLRPGTEPHSYEPSPQDILAVENCRVFVYGGGESDVWLDRILESNKTENRLLLSLMDCVTLREEELQAHMTLEEEACEEEKPEYDEHVWTSPVNAMSIIEALRDTLSLADPDHAAQYAANAEAYLAELGALDADFRKLAASAKRRLLVFGDRFPFLYFVREYGLSYAAAFPGCSSGTDANPSTVAHLIDLMREEQIPVVFRCDLSAGQIARTISEATGAPVRTLYSAHTLSREDFQQGESYLSLMRRNYIALEEALS